MSYRLRELIRLGVAPGLLHDQSILHGGKGSAPPAPDYRGAAQEQSQASKEATTAQTWANRPTQNTPWGTQTWGTQAGTDPATGQQVTQWTQNQQLTPELQSALDSQVALQGGRSDLAQDFMGRVEQDYAQPFDWQNLPEAAGSMGQAQQEAYGRMQQFQAPERGVAREQMDARLANQGLTPGSRAYETEMRRMADQEGRQDLQNLTASFGEGRAQGGFQNQLRQQAIAEEAQRRGMSLNEMNALLTGQQVNAPQMPSFMGSQQYQPPQYMQAANLQGQYGLNAQQLDNQANSGLWGGLGSLAGAGAMAYGMYAMSDARLKSRIVKVGEHPIGVGIYEYDIFGVRERGVMAQELLEVAPWLVYDGPGGWLMVDYGGL